MDEEEGEAVCTSSSAAAWHLQARRALKHDTAAGKKNMWRAPPPLPSPPSQMQVPKNNERRVARLLGHTPPKGVQ